MVAYSFKPGFILPIRQREKQQTIRLPRKRHARAGEQLQFFTGPRMRPTRVGVATCQHAREIRLDFARDVVEIDDALSIAGEAELNAFAIRDGFRPPEWLTAPMTPWEYMRRWWALTHPGKPVFAGVIVDWGLTFETPPTLEAAT